MFKMRVLFQKSLGDGSPITLDVCEDFLHTFHIKICTHKTPWEWNYYVVVV
jgi:hypothetical protein